MKKYEYITREIKLDYFDDLIKEYQDDDYELCSELKIYRKIYLPNDKTETTMIAFVVKKEIR